MSQLSRGQKRRLMYIEQKSGYSDDGPARIGWVTFSKTKKTIYYKDQAFQTLAGSGISGNYFDTVSGDEYWISGVKKEGSNRHTHGRGNIEIDEDAIDEYNVIINSSA